MDSQSHVGILMIHFEVVKVFHHVAHTNFKDWYLPLMAEGTPLFKHLLVVLLGFLSRSQ